MAASMTYRFAALLIALVGVPFAALAELREVASRVEAVSIQLDSALVRRLATIELEGGVHELVFPDLPAPLDRRTLQVAVNGSEAAIGRPVFRPALSVGPTRPAARSIQDEIEALVQERRAERDVIETQHLVLDILRQPLLRIEGGGERAPSEIDGLFDMVRERAGAALETARAAEREIDRLDALIERKQRELERLEPGPGELLELTLPVEMAASGTLRLELTYRVFEVGFEPVYEAALESGTGTVRLRSFVEIRQATGEDWTEVALDLSTVRPSFAVAPPEPGTWYIDVERPMAARMQAPAPMAEAAMATRDFAADLSGFDARYRLLEPATIPDDGTAHRFLVDDRAAPAELVWRTVPAFDPTVYLTTALVHQGEAPLLPGRLLLYRDGATVGETWLEALQPGETIDLGFGADPAVEVERRELVGERSQSGFIGQTARHERRYAIELTNRRAEPVTVEVIDRLPVPRDTRIEVTLLPETTPPPTVSDRDDERGVLGWTIELAPQASETVTFAYTVRHPADLPVTGF